MTPTRYSSLLEVAFAAGVVVWCVLHFTFAQLPPAPWTAAPTLALIALANAVSAINVRARVRGRTGGNRLDPFTIARLAVFAKASAYTAAVGLGVFAGFLIFVAPKLARGVGQHGAVVSGVTVVAALLMIGAALFLEHSCRVPGSGESGESDEDEQDDMSGGHGRG